MTLNADESVLKSLKGPAENPTHPQSKQIEFAKPGSLVGRALASGVGDL